MSDQPAASSAETEKDETDGTIRAEQLKPAGKLPLVSVSSFKPVKPPHPQGVGVETSLPGSAHMPAVMRSGPGEGSQRLSAVPVVKALPSLQVLSYTGGQTQRYGDPAVSGRFSFTGNPAMGDASIAVADLRGSDTATYQCKVKKAPGVDMRKVTLVVMGEAHFLSKPVLPVSFLTVSGCGHEAPIESRSDTKRCSIQQFPRPRPSAGWKGRRRRAVRCPSAASPRRAPPPSATPGAARAAASCRRRPPRVRTQQIFLAVVGSTRLTSRLSSALPSRRHGERRAADQEPHGRQRGKLRLRGEELGGER